MRILIRICDAALSAIEVATCDPNAIDRIIIEDNRGLPHLPNCTRAITDRPICLCEVSVAYLLRLR